MPLSWFEFGVSTGTGLDGELPLGGRARGALYFGNLPVFGTVSLGGQFAGEELRSQWVLGSAGLGVSLPQFSPNLAFDLRLEWVVQRFRVTAEQQTATERVTDAATRQRFGTALGLAGALKLFAGVHGVAAVEGNWMWPEIDVFVGGEDEGRLPALGWGAILGFRVVPSEF